MNLHHYPQEIYELAEKLNGIEAELSRIRNEITLLENLAEAAIAFDPTLKNDLQRKAWRNEVLSVMDNYPALQNQLIELTQIKADAMAQLERARNAFSAAKLEARTRIAQQIAGVDLAHELVGI